MTSNRDSEAGDAVERLGGRAARRFAAAAPALRPGPLGAEATGAGLAGDRSAPAGQAALALVQAQASAFLHHLPDARAGAASVAALLEMREAGRRLRTALDIFSGFLPRDLRGLAGELDWLGALLSGLRALGMQMEVLVQIEPSRTPLFASPEESVELTGLFREELLAARMRLQAALASPRSFALEEALRRLLSDGFAPDGARDGEPIGPIAARLLKERFRVYRDLGDELAAAAPASGPHALRAPAEALYHALEFFEPLFGAPARDLLARAARVEELLCGLQDACFAISLLRSLARGREAPLSAATLFALGVMAERQHRNGEKAERRFARAFRKSTGKRWHRLNAALGPG